jgi:hypothetical protein
MTLVLPLGGAIRVASATLVLAAGCFGVACDTKALDGAPNEQPDAADTASPNSPADGGNAAPLGDATSGEGATPMSDAEPVNLPDADGIGDAGDATAPHGASLLIRIRNTSDQVRYIEDPGHWVRSGSSLVHDFDGGYGQPNFAHGDLSLYTNQPTCEGVVTDDFPCGAHGDGVPEALFLEAGAEFVSEWSAIVWQRSARTTEPTCDLCMVEQPAPAAPYRVELRVGAQLDCFGEPSCQCTPESGSCVSNGTVPAPAEEVTRDFDWPQDREVVIDLE